MFNNATLLIHMIYSHICEGWIICCCVNGLHDNVCLQFYVDMITATLSSANGIELYLLAKYTEIILWMLFGNPWMLICQ